jgi:cobalt-zinc-cadmium efflux system membrane fusion protein
MYAQRNAYVYLGLLVLLQASCQKPQPAMEEQHEQSISLTRWTNKTELFVEFSSLVVDKETSFAAHLTDIATFQPVSTDVLIARLEEKNGQHLTARAETPVVPGIYRPVITPDRVGVYRLTFHRAHPKTQEIYDTIDAGEVEVVAKAEALPEHEEAASQDGITFLKEQQWRTEFATTEVRQQEFMATVKRQAEVKPAAGREVHVTTPVAGRIFAMAKGAPTPGQKVEPGEPLAIVLPLHSSGTNRTELESTVSIAQSELAAAEHELARVQALYVDRIVPKRRLEQAQKDVAIVSTRLAAARSQLALLETSQTLNMKAPPPTLERFTLRSPIAGTVVATHLTPGALIHAGQELFTIVDLERVWIEGRLFEPDIPKVRAFDQARFVTLALSEPLVLAAPHAHLVTIGSMLDPTNRSVPLLVEVRNLRSQLKIGMRGELHVPTGETVQGLALPLSAVVDDKGIAVAFVQREGETFERRELELGIQGDGSVQVKTGLVAGERVVTKGAYRVHLASFSTELPAHGHAH